MSIYYSVNLVFFTFMVYIFHRIVFLLNIDTTRSFIHITDTMDNMLIERIFTIRRVVRARQLAAVHLIVLLVAFVTCRRLNHMNRANLPTKELSLHLKNVREKMLHNLSTSGKCRDVIRMSMNAFRTLCDILVHHGGLRPTQRMSVEEHVARFFAHCRK